MGIPSEVKEMLKEFGDDPFGNDEELLGDGGRRFCDACAMMNGRESRGLADLAPPLSAAAIVPDRWRATRFRVNSPTS
jgi:hypothetical protein